MCRRFGGHCGPPLEFLLLAYGLSVKTHIFSRRASPAVVAFERAFNERSPVFLVRIRAQRSAYRAEHIMGIVALEGEAVALAVAGVGDAVLESAGFADYRESAVSEREHAKGRTARSSTA